MFNASSERRMGTTPWALRTYISPLYTHGFLRRDISAGSSARPLQPPNIRTRVPMEPASEDRDALKYLRALSRTHLLFVHTLADLLLGTKAPGRRRAGERGERCRVDQPQSGKASCGCAYHGHGRSWPGKLELGAGVGDVAGGIGESVECGGGARGRRGGRNQRNARTDTNK